ncbi:hypothetical protein Ancab_029000 [Ancistrocladus abbreviatus]
MCKQRCGSFGEEKMYGNDTLGKQLWFINSQVTLICGRVSTITRSVEVVMVVLASWLVGTIVECRRAGRNPLASVLALTGELAKQVEKEYYESAPRVDTVCVYRGTPINSQMRFLDRGVDVVVGTPGRVIDLMKRGALSLSEVQFIVLHEANQMLNVGFEEAVEVILEKLPQTRQRMMFSATMPNWIMQLTRKYMQDPLTIDLVRMNSCHVLFMYNFCNSLHSFSMISFSQSKLQNFHF